MSVAGPQQQASFVGLETLEARQLLSSSPTAVTTVRESEGNDTFLNADTFTLPGSGGVNLVGRFQKNNDRDLFRFTASRSGRVLVNLAPKQNGFPRLTIKEPGGPRALRLVPGSDATFGEFRTEVGREYVVQVDPNAPLASNQYRVQLRYFQGGARSRDGGSGSARNRRIRINPGQVQTTFETELNNSQRSANSFTFPTINTVNVLRGLSNNTRDRDFFTFRSLRSGEMRFAVRSLNSTATNARPTYLKVFDKFGSLVGEIESPANGKLVRFDGFVDQGQTYFVLARARVFKPTFYQINIRYREVF